VGAPSLNAELTNRAERGAAPTGLRSEEARNDGHGGYPVRYRLTSRWDAAHDELAELAGDRPVLIKVRIEDRNFQAACARLGEQALQQSSRFIPAQTALVTVIDGRHDRVIEHINIEVHPETPYLWLGHGSQRTLKDERDGPGTQVSVVEHGDAAVPDVFTGKAVVVIEVAVTDQRDVLGTHQRHLTIEVSERSRAPAGGQGEIQRRDLAVRLVIGMLKVRVPVQIDQAVAASPSQRQQGAQNYAAVTAQHHRQPMRLKRGLDDISQGPGHFGDAIRIEDAGGGVPSSVVGRHRYPPCIVAAETGMQADCPKHLRRQFYARGAKP
jgi:hypothetical protein